MAKSRARFLSELLGTTGLVKKSKSALAGADEIIDLSTLPSIPNSKLTNSSITINSNATSLGGSVTLTTANVAENTNLYYTDARADARIAAADTGDLSEGSNLYYTNARADARVNLQTGSNLDLSSKDTGDLSEGSNLYYTNARADARIAAATTDDLSEGSSNLYYTDARADARVALIVDSAPGTLNTLNELAAALGDDANFSTTVTNSIAAKLPLAGGTMTGAINMNSNNLSGINNGMAVSFLSTNGYWVGGTQRMNGSGDLVNIGTISSGAITASASGAVASFNRTDNDAIIELKRSGSVKGYIGANTSGDIKFYNNTAAGTLTISSAGNLGTTGTISSGAITSTGSSSFGDVAIGGAADSNYDLKVYGLARFQGAANFVDATNPIQVGGTTVIDASRNLTNIASIDLPNANNWSYIKNNTASGGLRFGTKNAGGTYSDQIEISATGNYVKLNRNTTVTGTINSGAITSTSSMNAAGGYYVSGTEVVDASRNLTNINSMRVTGTSGIGIGTAPSGFGSGVSTLLLQGTSSTNGRAGALWFKEQDGTPTSALYSTDGNDGYGTVLAAYQGSLKLGIGGIGASNIALTIDTSKNTTFAGTISSGVLTVNGGSTNVVANFVSTDSIVGIKLEDNNGNVELSASGSTFRIQPSGGVPTFEIESNGTAHFKGGILKIGTADSSSGHLNAYELMSFNIDSDNDDTNRHFAWYKNGESASGTEMMKLDEDNLLSLSGTALVENAKLKAIAESNTQTAIDVFVYDTRKDSDGGAWRKRTQNTSWYNETLNTSTRGARKEFPSVAVIVIASNNVIIYDGDDPDMPMWMVFPADAYITWASNSDTGTSCVSALNSKLFIGNSNDYGDCIVDFVSDDTRLVYNNNNYALTKRTVVDRNILESTEFPLYYAGGDGYNIVNPSVNDVAMTVLPNAPIDPDTGLPVPTIAVATNGGVSVIKDDGSVVDITASAGASYNGVGFISFDSNHNMIFEQDNVGRSLFYMPIPSADTTSTTSSAAPTDKKMLPSSSANTTFPKFNGSNATLGIGGSGGDQYIHGGTGVTHYAQGPSDATSSVAYITSDYNTGWMNGAIKLATLSDTDTTNATGSELITNGTFDSDISGWSSGANAVLSHSSSGIANAATGYNSYAYIDFTLTAGKQYIFKADITSDSQGSGGAPRIAVTETASDSTFLGSTATSGVGSYYVTFTATGATRVRLIKGSNSGTTIYDNVSLRLAEPDRSVNGNGLQVFGTVTKTAVATGAELVGYSGFSSSNALQTYYSSAYAVGTQFSASMWLKGGASSQTPFSVESNSSSINDTDSTILVHLHATGFYFYTRGANDSSWGTTGAASITSTAVGLASWHMVTISQDSAGRKLYIDGKLNVSDSVVKTIDGVEGTLVVTCGARPNLTQNYTGDIALVRFSGSPVTPEQAAKMYNDEKHLFATNAKATLYGSSDAVTALAYDDDTELLHVGTSAGRSEFQGLNRVDNTTDAVGAAISASNGFIVEE